MLTHNAIPQRVLRNIERIPNTNDLWLAEATRAVKNPGKGDYKLVLIGPNTEQGGSPRQQELAEGYIIRGWLREANVAIGRWRVTVHSPIRSPNTLWVAAHHADVFACDYATARRLLVVLAKELVYDRP